MTAGLDELGPLLREGGAASLRRFAGFRGEEAVSGEDVVVRLGAVAYAQAIPSAV